MRERSIVIVGAGMAGLAAGLLAAEAGGRPLVLEKGLAAGGSLALSGGLMWAPRDFETFRRFVPRGRPDMQRLLVDEIDAAWRRLETSGFAVSGEIPCIRGGLGRGRWILDGAPGARGPFAAAIAARIEELGGTVRHGTAPVSLSRSGGVYRLEVACNGGVEEIDAATVILATGGFQCDRDLLRRYVTPEADAVILRSNPFSDGSGLRLGLAAGANLSEGMESFYGHVMARIGTLAPPPEQWSALAQYYACQCVAVNVRGQRFADETEGFLDETVAQEGSRQPQGRYFLLFDTLVRERYVAGDGAVQGIGDARQADRLDRLRTSGGDVVETSSLDALMRDLAQRGVAPNGLRATLRLKHPALQSPPFYAVECVTGVTNTTGGLAVDERLQVRARERGLVPGLYAAGADAGGLFVGVTGGELGWALASGFVAARSALSDL